MGACFPEFIGTEALSRLSGFKNEIPAVDMDITDEGKNMSPYSSAYLSPDVFSPNSETSTVEPMTQRDLERNPFVIH